MVFLLKQKDLTEYLERLEEAKEDHQKIRKRIILLFQKKVGAKGLPLWLPKELH